MTPAVYVIATMDTKGFELGFVAEILRRRGFCVRIVDVGTLSEPSVVPDVTRDEVRAAASRNGDTSSQRISNHRNSAGTDRASAIGEMAECLRRYLLREQSLGCVLGIIGLGGSGGTSLISHALRAMPIGLPKLLVSTVASGNVAPYVDCSDILMMYSVVDVSGLNAVSEVILSNAAFALAGMVQQPLQRREARPAIGMTMFGVTTPCVTQVRERLESQGYDCLVFHATGTGGRAMEQLVASGLIIGVLDITTTEIADEVVGGVFPSGPHRFEKLIQSQIPLVLSLGALDMVNFGAIDTVPAAFRERRLHVHNAQVTLMRTTPDENRKIGRWIAEKLNQSTAPLTLVIPEGGLSLLDVPGQPFHDPEADAALFTELSSRLHVTAQRQLIRLPYDINNPKFSTALLQHFQELLPRA